MTHNDSKDTIYVTCDDVEAGVQKRQARNAKPETPSRKRQARKAKPEKPSQKREAATVKPQHGPQP
jgi:hypothetical protein